MTKRTLRLWFVTLGWPAGEEAVRSDLKRPYIVLCHHPAFWVAKNATRLRWPRLIWHEPLSLFSVPQEEWHAAAQHYEWLDNDGEPIPASRRLDGLQLLRLTTGEEP